MLIIRWDQSDVMEEDGPPIGMSEDGAYELPIWVKPLLRLIILVLPILPIVLFIVGLPLVTGAEHATKVWSFWGNTQLLGALFLL